MACKNPISPGCAFIYVFFSLFAAAFMAIVGAIEWSGYEKINGGKEYDRDQMKSFAYKFWWSALMYLGCAMLCGARWLYHYCTTKKAKEQQPPI